MRPGGNLLLANFVPDIRDVGYMETYMDWKLIYRTADEMQDVVKAVPTAEMQEMNLFMEENQNIVFLQLTRRAVG